MILLDTDVVSEPLRPSPEPGVIGWMDAQPLATLFLSAVTGAELRAGVAQLPAGQRLRTIWSGACCHFFADRVLPFDLGCTRASAELSATARAAGISVATADACIAAIALTHGMPVATRDSLPFEAAGAVVI